MNIIDFTTCTMVQLSHANKKNYTDFMKRLLAGRALALGLFILPALHSLAQRDSVSCNNVAINDSTPIMDSTSMQEIVSPKARKKSPYRIKPLQVLIPSTLITFGFVGLESDWLISRNNEIREELQEHKRKKMTIDNFTQYAPLATTYALRLCGLKGKHGYADLTIIAGTAYALMGISVNIMKRTTKVERPDGSTRNSFPSGHTATAFAGAELLRKEYWDVSPWIGVAGYTVAIGTGFFRMYNNRHWLTDVIAGAGIGILSTEAAYWLYPAISKTFFRKRYRLNTYLTPYLSSESKGLNCCITF